MQPIELAARLFRVCRLVAVITLAQSSIVAGQMPDPVTEAEAVRDAGDFKAAIDLLERHLRSAPTDTRARLVLAEARYWFGDFSGAAREFRNVLRADTTNVAARRQLNEIRAASAPWLRLAAHGERDTQPVERGRAELESGVFLNPLWAASIRIRAERAVAGVIEQDLLRAHLTLAGYFPYPRVELRITPGAAQSTGAETHVLGTAHIGWRGGAIRMGASIERELYNATIASIAAPFTTLNPRISASLDKGGWLGEAVFGREFYPDDNAVTTTYLWLLAPLLWSDGASLQAGYAGSYQDAEESRFIATGRYEPYFTPEQDMAHSVAAAAAMWSSKGMRFQINGSYAIYAHRNVPSERYTPYNVQATVRVPLSSRARFTIDAERMRTSYYSDTRVNTSVVVIFAPHTIH